MSKPTHFVTLTSTGTSSVTPMANVQNKPRTSCACPPRAAAGKEPSGKFPEGAVPQCPGCAQCRPAPAAQPAMTTERARELYDQYTANASQASTAAERERWAFMAEEAWAIVEHEERKRARLNAQLFSIRAEREGWFPPIIG